MLNSDKEEFDELEEVNDVLAMADNGDRVVRHQRHRVDPFDLPEVYFKARFRFSKIGVRRLIALVQENLNINQENNRGKPFNTKQVACTALNILGGGHFQRVQGDCTGSVQSTAHNFLYRYV